MIDEGQRRRRRVLGWVLLGLVAVLALGAVVLWEQVMLGTVSNSYALLTAIGLMFLALLGTGAYLLRTVRGQ